VLDASEPVSPADEAYFKEFAGKKRIVVRNKIDVLAARATRGDSGGAVLAGRAEVGDFGPILGRDFGSEMVPVVGVSCVTGEGVEALKEAIKGLVWSGDIRAEMLEVMINSRHQEALGRARSATLRTVGVLRSEETLELAAGELRIAVNAVGEIVGKTSTEDLLDSIFSQFCLGK
jgi:tRNA modification GTPase